MLGLQFIPRKGKNWTNIQSIALGLCSIAGGLIVIISLGYVWTNWEMDLMVKFTKKNLAKRNLTL